MVTLPVEKPLRDARKVIDVQLALVTFEIQIPAADERDLRPWPGTLDLVDVAGIVAVGADVIVGNPGVAVGPLGRTPAVLDQEIVLTRIGIAPVIADQQHGMIARQAARLSRAAHPPDGGTMAP